MSDKKRIVTLHLDPRLYEKIRLLAEDQYRTVPGQILQTLSIGLEIDPEYNALLRHKLGSDEGPNEKSCKPP